MGKSKLQDLKQESVGPHRTDTVIVIVGPTASGKSTLAIRLAQRYAGEIISADSRQVYRGMDIGSGKVPRDLFLASPEEGCSSLDKKTRGGGKYLSGGIAHHLIDVTSPTRSYNVTHFLRDANKSLADIRKRGNTPIICGGTGFWIQALLTNTAFPPVKPDAVLRKKLARRSTEELFALLASRDSRRTATIDSRNKVRLIRALEIIEALGAVPASPPPRLSQKERFHIIALNPPQEILYGRIEARLKQRLEQGMIEEVDRLHTQGIAWKRLEDFGLEYRWCARFLQQKISRKEFEENLARAIKQYAKRQLTWLRRFEKMGARIHWATHTKEIERALKSQMREPEMPHI